MVQLPAQGEVDLRLPRKILTAMEQNRILFLVQSIEVSAGRDLITHSLYTQLYRTDVPCKMYTPFNVYYTLQYVVEI